MNLEIDLNVIPLKKQVSLIWLSKVIFDRDQLEIKSGIPSSYIKYILSHKGEILTRWRNVSKRRKADKAINNIAESYRYRVIDNILGEWIHRSNVKRSPRTVQPLEIEDQANLIKQQLSVATYYIGMHIWNKEFMHKVITAKSDSLDIAKILYDIQNEVLEDIYTEFKEKLRLLRLKQLNEECHHHIEKKDQRNCFNVSHEKHITETTDSSGASIASINVEDLTESDAEECGDQQIEDIPMGICQYEDLTNILSDSEDVELPSSFDNSQNKDRDGIFVIDELDEKEELCQKSSKHKSETMELSSEHDENSNDDILEVLGEEKQTQDSSYQSSSNISINAANLNVDEVIEIEESSNSPQHGNQSIVLQTTDSIEELVKKYEMYNNKHQQQHHDNELFGQNVVANQREGILNDKLKSDNNILPKSMQFGFLMQKKICIEECSSKNSTDISNDTNNKYNRMKGEKRCNTTTAHLNKEDEVVTLTLDDEIENSNSEEHENPEHVACSSTRDNVEPHGITTDMEQPIFSGDTLKTLTIDRQVLLIRSMRKQPRLYQNELFRAPYMLPHEKQRLWEIVAKESGFEKVDDAICKWRYLTACMRKHLDIETKTAPRPFIQKTKDPQYKYEQLKAYFKELEYIIPYIQVSANNEIKVHENAPPVLDMANNVCEEQQVFTDEEDQILKEFFANMLKSTLGLPRFHQDRVKTKLMQAIKKHNKK